MECIVEKIGNYIQMKTHRVSLTEGEIYILAHLTRHFADYVGGDDRPDHGLALLSQYRTEYKERMRKDEELPGWLKDFTSAMGKLNRKDRKIRWGKVSQI